MFLLIHGAFRGGWSWDRVVPLLEQHGHRAVAPDLPFAGSRWVPGHPAVSLDDYTTDIISTATTLVDEHTSPVVIVGHSQGGFIARAAVEAAPNLFSAIGYLDAPIPEHGLRGIDLRPPATADVAIPDLDPAFEFPAVPLVAHGDLTDANVAWMNPLLTPQPVGPSLTPMYLTDPQAAQIPVGIAFCADTPEFYPAWRTRASMDEAGHSYTLIDAGHDAPVTNPTAVADWILREFTVEH